MQRWFASLTEIPSGSRVQGKEYIVRLIGVDTPETVHPTKTVQHFGAAASAYTKAALEAKTVTLEADPTGDTRDRYGRLLRYVHLDGQNFNARLIREGYAHAYRLFPFSKRKEFISTGRTSEAPRDRLMEPPLGSRSCGLVQRLRATRPGGPLFAPRSPRSIDRKSPAAPRRSQPSGCAPKSYFAPNGNRLQVTPCSRASRRRVRFGPTQAPRQTALLAFGVCHSTLLLSSRPVIGAVSAFLPRPGLAVFRPFAGERKTLTNP